MDSRGVCATEIAWGVESREGSVSLGVGLVLCSVCGLIAGEDGKSDGKKMTARSEQVLSIVIDHVLLTA